MQHLKLFRIDVIAPRHPLIAEHELREEGDVETHENDDGGDPRQCQVCIAEGREGGRLALRGGKFGAFIACSNYPECKYTRQFASPGGSEAGGEDAVLARLRPVWGTWSRVSAKTFRSGRFTLPRRGAQACGCSQGCWA